MQVINEKADGCIIGLKALIQKFEKKPWSFHLREREVLSVLHRRPFRKKAGKNPSRRKKCCCCKYSGGG